MHLARKVTRAKWKPKPGLQPAEIPADAVTVDLRTSDNVLSFWRCGEASRKDLERIALAMAAKFERVDRVEVLWLAEKLLEEDRVQMRNTPGDTPVKAMVDQHVDAVHLDLVRLGSVARRVAESLQSDRYLAFTRAEVINLLRSAIAGGLVDVSALREKVRVEVGVGGS